jgi:outer membrane protein assembly factor BamB
VTRAALPLTILLASLLLHGCTWIRSWGDPEPGDPAPLVEFESSLEVRKVWSTSIGDGMGKQGLSMGPAFSSGLLYAADHEGVLVAVDAESGRKAWQLKTKQAFSGGPGLDSELDAVSGRRLWIHDHNVPLLTLRGNADLLVRGGVVFVGYDDGSVTSLRVADGSVIWSQTIASQEGRTELERLADIGQGMVLVASDLIVSSYKSRVVSLAADSGRLLWFKDISSATGVQVDRTNLVISERNGDLWMLDRRNGSTVWKLEQMTNRGLTRPAFYGNYVVVGDKEGYLHWLDQDIGSFVARVRADRKGFAAAPMSVGTTLFVLTHKGKLIAYRAGAAI